jgi:hypothetical protein
VLTASGRRQIEAALIVVPPIALLWVMVGNAPVPWRSAVAAVFFLVSPGMAVLAPVRFRLEIELTMLFPTSLATTSLVSLGLFYGGVWTPTLAVVCLCAVCAVGVLAASARGLADVARPLALSNPASETDHRWVETDYIWEEEPS